MRPHHPALAAATTLLLSTLTTTALRVDFTNPTSIKSAAKELASGLNFWYTGGIPGQIVTGIPGLLPQPYFWWEAGAMFGTLMDYWYYTGDNQFNDIVTQGMLFQVGADWDYMPSNWSQQMGNDDQAFWAMSALTAAEYKFPNPPPDQPQWLALAQAVWNTQQLRWDTQYCQGGLRWQVFTLNKGYDYKNTPANAGFMNIGARLYAYTGNTTYLDWAVKTWDWMIEHKYIGGYMNYTVYDGAFIDTNCTAVNPLQWTYSVGILINACAVLWNVTQDQQWQDRAEGLWGAAGVSSVSSCCDPC